MRLFRKQEQIPTVAPPVQPHCDPLILHAPKRCEFCDHYPEAQALRMQWGINFTGEHDPSKLECPAERKRTIGMIERWSGNRPQSYYDADNSIEGVLVVYDVNGHALDLSSHLSNHLHLTQEAGTNVTREEIEEIKAQLKQMEQELDEEL